MGESAGRTDQHSPALVPPGAGDRGQHDRCVDARARVGMTLRARPIFRNVGPSASSPREELDVLFPQTCRRSRRVSGHSAARARSSSAPSVCSSRNASSASPPAKRTCIAPSASAASLPGRRGRWMSAALAVRVRTGSTQTIVAPRLRELSRKNFQRCKWVETMLAPQAITDRACTASSMSAVGHPPYVIPHAVAPAAKQIVPSIFVAPSALKNRMSIDGPPCSTPAVPM